MFAAIIVAAVMATAWFFIKSSFSRVKLDMPYLEFEGDNSAARYASGTREIMKKGYEQVTYMLLSSCVESHVFLQGYALLVYQKGSAILHVQSRQL